ncbi:MLP-like protein 43 [Silene latifolia]|uniref:MLP-like protein 43 n=1 Tax=Silene latifolia TaxID=37657 RepID=UPI003D77973B
MSQIEKAEGQIEIKSQADKFFELWTRKSNLISEWCPDKYPKIELHEGSFHHSLGAVTTWHFIALGHHDFVKTKVAEIDETNKFVIYNYFEGLGVLRSNFKYLKSKIQVIPKGDEGCIVKWSFEYEKKSDDAPDASLYIDFLLDCTKNLDARLCAA